MATSEFFFATSSEPMKPGVRIEEAKYDAVRIAIIENLRTHGSMTFTQLGDLVEDQLQKNFDGSVMWYYTNVKLDMEACGEILRVPKSKPQLISLSDESQD
jgi:hypothetical protein